MYVKPLECSLKVHQSLSPLPHYSPAPHPAGGLSPSSGLAPAPREALFKFDSFDREQVIKDEGPLLWDPMEAILEESLKLIINKYICLLTIGPF